MDINELRRLAQAATPGPWIGCGPSFGESLPKYLNEVVVDREGDEDDGYSVCTTPIGLEDQCSDDMAFIAATNPAAISELLDRLEAAEKERDEFKRACFAHISDNSLLLAKIEQMERQEPVAIQHQVPSVNFRGECVGYSEWKDGKGLEHWPRRTLYALPGAKGEEK